MKAGYCLTNYTVQCKDVASGKVGCFLFDTLHWQRTGEFLALSEVFPDLAALYANTTPDERKGQYIERLKN